MVFGRKNRKQKRDSQIDSEIQEALAADPQQLEADAGRLGEAFIGAVDKAVHLQTGTIRTYVNWLRRQDPDASPAEIQKRMDSHLKRIVSGTGAGAGAAAAVPGVGLITGTAAIAGESALFLDLVAFYAVASAYLRGEDISDPERRRALVLSVLMGSKGVAIVDAMLGEDAQRVPGRATLAKFSGPTLVETNNVMQKMMMRSLSKQMRRAFLGKLLPLGLGAVAGTAANRKLVDKMIDNVQSSLGAVPAGFAAPLPEKETAEEQELGKRMSLNPKEFAAWFMERMSLGDGSTDAPEEDTEDTEDTADTEEDTADSGTGSRNPLRALLRRGKESGEKSGTKEDENDGTDNDG